MKNEYATLTFELYTDESDDFSYREASKIEMRIPSDMTIHEFKTVCKRMAAAIGYTQKSIESAFGNEDYDTSLSTEFITSLLLD